MRFLISYTSTNFASLKKFWDVNQSSARERIGSSISKPERLGGMLAIADTASDKIIMQKKFQKPLALHKKEDGLFLCALSSNQVLELNEDLEIVDSFSSPLFSSIHSIDENANGLLLASTGIDAIVRYAKDATSQVVWSATESERYATFPDGSRREIDFSIDHSQASYPTLQQTTHVNSAAFVDENIIISTLFHQGELIKIDMLTGNTEILLDGMRSPHGAHVYFKNDSALAICSDTLHNKVMLDIPIFKDGQNQAPRVLEDGFNWVQDTKYYPDDDLVVVLDSNNHRICFYSYSDLKPRGQYRYDVGNRIFDVLRIR